jgi:hypothetical protein
MKNGKIFKKAKPKLKNYKMEKIRFPKVFLGAFSPQIKKWFTLIPESDRRRQVYHPELDKGEGCFHNPATTDFKALMNVSIAMGVLSRLVK